MATGWEVMRKDALAAAKSRNVNWDENLFDLDYIHFHEGVEIHAGYGWANLGRRGAWGVLDNAALPAHELGHNLGLNHANLWVPTERQTVIGPGSSDDYDDAFDVMGRGDVGGTASGPTRGHFNAYGKYILGWIPDSAVATTPQTGGTYVYRVRPHDLGNIQANQYYAVKIPRPDGRHYWFSVRRHRGLSDNPWVSGGVEVHLEHTSNGGHSQLLDTTAQSFSVTTATDSRETADSALAIGRTFSDAAMAVHVTPTASYPDGSVDLRVTRGAPSPNAPSVSFTAAPESVAPGQAASFAVSASDADGGPFYYHWDFGDRTFGSNAAATKAWA